MDDPSGNLAKAIAEGTASNPAAWETVIRESRRLLGQARLNTELIQRLGIASGDPKHFEQLLALLAEKPVRHPADEGPLQYLQLLRDPHPFSLEAWIAAILLVHDHARSRQVEAGFRDYVDFVGCCAEFGSRQNLRSELRAVTHDMLEEFGFQGPGQDKA